MPWRPPSPPAPPVRPVGARSAVPSEFNPSAITCSGLAKALPLPRSPRRAGCSWCAGGAVAGADGDALQGEVGAVGRGCHRRSFARLPLSPRTFRCWRATSLPPLARMPSGEPLISVTSGKRSRVPSWWGRNHRRRRRRMRASRGRTCRRARSVLAGARRVDGRLDLALRRRPGARVGVVSDRGDEDRVSSRCRRLRRSSSRRTRGRARRLRPGGSPGRSPRSQRGRRSRPRRHLGRPGVAGGVGRQRRLGRSVRPLAQQLPCRLVSSPVRDRLGSGGGSEAVRPRPRVGLPARPAG